MRIPGGYAPTGTTRQEPKRTGAAPAGCFEHRCSLFCDREPPLLRVVHCVDTEGTLYESLEETFERLRAIYGVALPPTSENVERIQPGSIDMCRSESTRVATLSLYTLPSYFF